MWGFCVCGFSTVQNSSGAHFEDFHVTTQTQSLLPHTLMLANTNAANLADPNDLLGLGITVLVPDDQFDESSVVTIADSNL